MKPYLATGTCSKCGGSDVADRFHKAATDESRWGYSCWLDEPCWGQRAEHILRHCRRCSFEWFEATLSDTPVALFADRKEE